MPLFAWAIIFLVAQYAIQAITMKTQAQKPAALSEFDFPQFEENTPQPVVFGDVWLNDWMILWYGDYATTKIKSGGKK